MDDRDAQYMAECEVMPKFYMTPLIDREELRRENTLKELSLRTLVRHKTLKRALRSLEPYGVTRMLWRSWVINDANFAAAVEAVSEDIGEYFEGIAIDRVEGGEGSDALLLKMMQAYRPQRYAQVSKVEHTGAGGGPIKVSGVKERLTAKINMLVVRMEQKAATLEGSGGRVEEGEFTMIPERSSASQ
jgi:hypothetical protein